MGKIIPWGQVTGNKRFTVGGLSKLILFESGLATLWQCVTSWDMFRYHIIAQNSGGIKLWWIDCFVSFGEESAGGFTIANISYFSEPGIWLGKILANGIYFAKFAKFSPTKILGYTVYHSAILWSSCAVG